MKIPQIPRVKTTQELLLEAEKERLKNCYLYIDTNFKRKSESIFVLAFMEYKRRVNYKDIGNLYFQSDSEILNMVSKFVKEDYFTCNGQIKIWGNIISYNWHHVDGKVYIFNTNGDYISKNKNNNESKAILTIKGK